MKEIRLTNGWAALVDDADYEWLSAMGNWCAAGTGKYPTIYGPGGSQTMHRIIMAPVPPGLLVDHINMNKLDNRRCNLRLATEHQSHGNIATKSTKKSSRYKGVYPVTGYTSWRVQIGAKGRTIYLGVYKTEEDAARAYDAAAREYFGEFARLNFPGESISPARLKREYARVKVCRWGHPMTGDNVRIVWRGPKPERSCIECARRNCRERRRKLREASAA